ncbi:isoleucine--tRNA ligase, partial [Flavobacteriales bacterium]|nr:isoleucine--tRNA ligase [Flavobacteriales bacterium]
MFPEYKKLDLVKICSDVGSFWKQKNTFKQSVKSRPSNNRFVFFEGPPSANGLPGIHHVMARLIKDIFCRYKTLCGFRVERKAGWDTHGLPVELSVEKSLGINKEDIGRSISVANYNEECKKTVMKYTQKWNDLTEKMGYWVDVEDAYVTYKTKYIESVWYLVKRLFEKNLFYRGYTIQPYSPAAGTGLSSHELNQPGCYKQVKDLSVFALFKLIDPPKSMQHDVYFVAWTTTPWTLFANTGLAVGKNITYLYVETLNPFNSKPIVIVCAEDCLDRLFDKKTNKLILEKSNKTHTVLSKCKGSDLVGLKYDQLLKNIQPAHGVEAAFRVVEADFVTTDSGTGVVHLAPTFGADDFGVAKQKNIPPMLISGGSGAERLVPIVDQRGRFVKEMGEFGGRFVKSAFSSDPEYPSVDLEIVIKLKKLGLAFKSEKHEHSYPHCWRTDKPILYYPLDSWFIKTTEYKDALVEKNKEINWKPKSTGEGRFQNWLENLNDWNVSRSRFWGIPIPLWKTEDGEEVVCIGSVEELKEACEVSVLNGHMEKNPFDKFKPGDMSESNYDLFDLHKNIVDNIVLTSEGGAKMFRDPDVLDVWFDSGSMPFAQWHYPFENKKLIDSGDFFPADFIAEGVDQTRGWFFTLHAISVMCFNSVAYKNVISNGLVLDSLGQKMSKRLGNSVEPFDVLNEHGSDAVRWYMITNAQPWDNLKFNLQGVVETKQKFFSTLYNIYSFFALYANIDNFSFCEEKIPTSKRHLLDQWIISETNTLIKEVGQNYNNYEPTLAGRKIQTFVIEKLSNWYVRLCRRRFWKGVYDQNKISAYQT